MTDHGMYLAFPAFEALGWVRHGFSTRRGGVSRGELATLNLGLHRGDEPENVRENRRRICRALGVDPKRMTGVHQVHSTRVLRAEAPFAEIPEADGLVTDVPGLVLTTSHADCTPLFLADPVHRAIGLAHAGWRGTGNGMAGELVRAMKENYGSRPEELWGGIGPAIGPCCYQVGEDVAEAFRNRGFGEQFLKPDAQPGKYLADLWGLNRAVWLECGLRPEQIQVAGICTREHPETFFSHRYQGERRGTMLAFLAITE